MRASASLVFVQHVNLQRDQSMTGSGASRGRGDARDRMIRSLQQFWDFIIGSLRVVTRGHGRLDIGVYTWLSLAANVSAFVIFVVPGMTPDVLGEVYLYNPSLVEMRVATGIWAVGALLFTLMLKVALAINVGEFRARATRG